MDITMDRDGSVIGSLFQQIISDMKNTSPLWEDFVAKATKLHICLRAAIQAIASYLDAFQKIADAATNSKGASKEIGTALTRVCLRHKAVETRMKTFTSAIMDCLILPLQEKLEDWKRQCAILDKEHAKEYKRCRTELKKRSSDTLRLQKKAKKGQSDTIQSLVDSSMHDVTLRRVELEEVEKKSLRAAMIEERTRYCTFVNMLQPVVKEECEVMSELGHLQEAMTSIALVTKEPNILPQSSEELILETKTTLSLYPESPGGSNSAGCSNSLGSRKSSVCSISSMNSSGSSGSPGHQYQRSLSQLMAPTMRLKPGESSDSGFCSSPALVSQTPSTTNPTHAVSTWPPHTQDGVSNSDRPHTISSAYEKGHQRPALTVYTFQSPENSQCDTLNSQKSPGTIPCRPPLPIRCSSLERPLSATGGRNTPSSIPRQCPSPIPLHITKEHPQLQPTYVNMSELASMAALKITNNNQQQSQHQQLNSPVSIASSLISSDSSATNQQSSPDVSSFENQTPQNSSPNTNTSPQTPIASNNQSSNFEVSSTNKDGNGGSSNITTTSASSENNETNILSPENDIKCKGSVLDKKSMFEKLEKIQNNNPIIQTSTLHNHPPRSESIYGKRNEEIYKSAGMLDRDTDQYEDSIVELNNLIGELDLFQREHDLYSKHINNTKSNDKKIISYGGVPSTSSSSSSVSIIVTKNDNYDIDGDINEKLSNYSMINSNSNSSTTISSLNDTNLNDIDVDCYDLEINKKNGFENPSFMHLNNDNNVLFNDHSYIKQNSEIVVLRYKEKHIHHNQNTIIDSKMINSKSEQQKPSGLQRFSSFRSSNGYNPSSTPSSIHNSSTSISKIPMANCGGNTNSNNYDDYTNSKYNVKPVEDLMNNCDTYEHNIDEQLRSKPVVSPRPASLSGCVSRITRRSSVNSMKPPPPVRRSSSVTPSHNLATPKTTTPSLSQQNLMNSSSESLPPPPAFLLDTIAMQQQQQMQGGNNVQINVAETIKALTDIRHMPASPGVIRRAQNQIQQNNLQYSTSNSFLSSTQNSKNDSNISPMYTPQSTTSHSSSSNDSHNLSYKTPNSSHSSIYAQPKVSKMSSFRTQSPSPKQNTGLIAQLNARLGPNKQNQQQSPQQMYHQDSRVHQQQNYERHPYGQHHQQQQSSPSGIPNYHSHNQNQQQQHYIDGKHNQTYQHQNQHQQQYHYNQNIYVSTNPFITTPRSNYSPSSFGKETGQYSTTNYTTNFEKSGSVLNKTSVGFLENLNAKLAEQRLSGKAFAVRNLINSKALPSYDRFKKNPVDVQQPDPRMCHESLMDQIKRGATLKRNRTINDRSAPKIH